MDTILRCAGKAIASLPTLRMFQIMVFSILISAGVIFGSFAGIRIVLAQTNFLGEWDWFMDVGISFFAGTIAFFLYPLLLPVIATFFGPTIARAIEEEEYPHIASVEPPFWPSIMQDVKFTLKVIGLNILVLPLYLIPGLNLVLYYVLNGLLIGTEFFNIVAGRHVTQEEARRLRGRHRVMTMTAGMLIIFCGTIPLVQLVAPLWGVALMVHFFHQLKPNYKQQVLPPMR